MSPAGTYCIAILPGQQFAVTHCQKYANGRRGTSSMVERVKQIPHCGTVKSTLVRSQVWARGHPWSRSGYLSLWVHSIAVALSVVHN